MDEFSWLIKMLPEGVSVTAVLSVVVLFLRNLKELIASQSAQNKEIADIHKDTLEKVTTAHISAQKETREAFNAQLERVTDSFSDRHSEMQTKVNTLTEAHIKVSTETVIALNGLQAAVRDLQNKVK